MAGSCGPAVPPGKAAVCRGDLTYGCRSVGVDPIDACVLSVEPGRENIIQSARLRVRCLTLAIPPEESIVWAQVIVDSHRTLVLRRPIAGSG